MEPTHPVLMEKLRVSVCFQCFWVFPMFSGCFPKKLGKPSCKQSATPVVKSQEGLCTNPTKIPGTISTRELRAARQNDRQNFPRVEIVPGNFRRLYQDPARSSRVEMMTNSLPHTARDQYKQQSTQKLAIIFAGGTPATFRNEETRNTEQHRATPNNTEQHRATPHIF